MEDMKLEELHDRLVDIEKDNEQIRRENQLFESYITRKLKEKEKEGGANSFNEATMSQQQRNQRDRQLRQLIELKKSLTPEQKYEIANAELETLKQSIESGRECSEALLERLKAILEGTDLTIAEIRKEAFDFGRFLSAAENGRTGKYDAEKLVKYMEDKDRAKDALIGKLTLKNTSLKAQIMKAETQIKHKEDMGDDLKFIDFHQLQIENKKHVKDIDERNKKLLSLKLNSGKTVQTLNGLKKRLQDSMRMQDSISRDMQMKMIKYDRTKEDIGKARGEINRAKFLKKQQLALQLQITNMPDPLKFVDQKNTSVDLKTSVKNWERKIEIAEVAAKKARGILRLTGEHVDEIIRPEFLMSGGGNAGAITSEDEGDHTGGEDDYDN